MIKEEVQKVLDEESVTPNYIIQRYKQISDLAENETHVLKALDSLAKISGLFDTEEKSRETLTVWGGPSVEQLESIKDEKVLAHAEIEKGESDSENQEG